MLDRHELAAALKAMYQNARKNEQKLNIVLFGIKFSEELHNCRATTKNIRDEAFKNVSSVGGDSYIAEINLGKALAKYVNVKR